MYKNTAFKIPLNVLETTQFNYIIELEKHFNSIIHILNTYNDLDFAPETKADFIYNIEELQNGIIHILKEYLNGHPSKAYSLFSDLLSVTGIGEELLSIQQTVMNKNTLLFRVQKNVDSLPVTYSIKKGFLDFKKPFELFHPPFQLRKIVSTKRFSIPGYPALYISENLHTSYSECYPSSENGGFHCISFKNIRPLYFLDLTDINFVQKRGLYNSFANSGNNDDITEFQASTRFLEKIRLFQIILSTHIKIKYKEDKPIHFRSEYIIPQLMLQWLKANSYVVDGIKYKSCTANSKFNFLGNNSNFVLYVGADKESGFCPSLSSIFESTKVYSDFENHSESDIYELLSKVSEQLLSSRYKPLRKF